MDLAETTVDSAALVERFGTVVPDYRLTVRQVSQMCSEGILSSEDQVELIYGVLTCRERGRGPGMPSSERHQFLVQKIRALFGRLTSPFPVHVVSEAAMQVGDNCLLQPDITVITGSLDEYETRYPTGDDVLVCVEVAMSSLPRDRGVKAEIYAAAGIETYVIVDVEQSNVEVYTKPDASTKSYQQRLVATYGQEIVVDCGTFGQLGFKADEALLSRGSR